MNILTHPVHTGYQFDLAATGHEFYSLDTPGSGEVFWDLRSRPQPANFHRLRRLSDAPVNFDLVLAHYDQGFHQLKQLDLPLILKEHCMRPPFTVPPNWIERITYYSFASQAAAARWILPPEHNGRKAIIGMGIDFRHYRRRKEKRKGVLVVGQHIRSRGDEKGCGNLMRLTDKFPITVVGRGSEEIPGGVGPARDFNELRRFYRTHRVFLNPSCLLGMSTLEAMAAGMPVVTFRLLNSDIIRDGVNGFVADSAAAASRVLARLLKDDTLARRLGANARATIEQRFSARLFVERWKDLFRHAVYDYRPGTSFLRWKPFEIEAKPGEEREWAEYFSSRAFEYARVGHESRRMTFGIDGRVAEGAGGCEVFWDVKPDGARRHVLEISSGRQVTCRLSLRPDGTWRGRWLHYEKMPVIVSPLEPMP